MTFVSPGKEIKARHRFDPDAPEMRGLVKACGAVIEAKDIYAITFDTAWDMMVTITTLEWDVSLV